MLLGKSATCNCMYGNAALLGLPERLAWPAAAFARVAWVVLHAASQQPYV